MSKVDTAWLRMDSPSNLMMIVGVWIIKPTVSYAQVCQRIQERLLQYPRFGQRVQQDASGASWVLDTDFQIERHVVRETLVVGPKESEQTVLQARLAELAMQALDMRHPLWEFRLIEHYQGGSALMARLHHCIADGLALVAVTQTLVDGGAAPPRGKAKAVPGDATGGDDWLADTLIRPFTEAAVKTLDAVGDGAVSAMEMLIDPQKGLEHGLEKGLASSLELAKMAYHVVRDGAALALMPDDSPTRLKGTPGTRKRVAWCEPIPLDEVKAVGRALNCSINDVLLSCVAGALGSYLKSFGDAIEGKEIRAMVPVNLRPVEDAYQLGNRFGLAPVVLPIGIENPIERVFAVRARMGGMKDSMQPLLAFALLAVAGVLMKPAQDALLSLFSKKTTAVMTNVPGPRHKLKFCGATLEQNLFWVPQSGSVGLGVSILSYGGGVQFSVVSDTMLCPDPQKIVDRFEPEFAKLTLLTLMLPWGK
ncbi:MAG: wax ester/triacylglycerol synthase family O-acyltransferase [Gammaproteobacteria bacterium]|uniref:wax ester/triacylglycerol synthase family O-acyltransferase n=1 Tax=Rhodoferax sp. TaxID=50421 RepID=UPI0017CA4228|nr:wax ester/triacylglycerol synthase family O-acyltransferase [Rhodoferax sp.]MBU3898455.1 wax ester/triacylglycerol synthase family O-acyltransferase [Gammaproteobacteria bacterium]MBA3058075.1 wax ester/triacylglycerol synthase family O-acyltransferase [Rhodoferax sp.]MBU3998555.1 wax ester/triacylglycerol synthase family O-acyltransferase [Gammaproteobacteria bacterium]MBU4079229.1 wax ester/triacylglycerol synthase family O-acyltransferase [Gammaproteobacteria bacterium]MBU4113972.1 wax e